MFRSLSRGPLSLVSSLVTAGVSNWSRYLGFFSLRTHDELTGVPATELVYLHSKLMIADDRVVICGSANINDRSLLGDRDSEFCLYIEDQVETSFCNLFIYIYYGIGENSISRKSHG